MPNWVWQTELDNNSYDSYQATYCYSKTDFRGSLCLAPGPGDYDNMIIIPYGMGTLGRIAGEFRMNLISGLLMLY